MHISEAKKEISFKMWPVKANKHMTSKQGQIYNKENQEKRGWEGHWIWQQQQQQQNVIKGF